MTIFKKTTLNILIAGTALTLAACSEENNQTQAELDTYNTASGETVATNDVDDGKDGTVASRAYDDATNDVDDGKPGTVASRAYDDATNDVDDGEEGTVVSRELDAAGNGVDDGKDGTVVSRTAEEIAEDAKTSSEAKTEDNLADTAEQEKNDM